MSAVTADRITDSTNALMTLEWPSARMLSQVKTPPL
jgi:hypothetical protein